MLLCPTCKRTYADLTLIYCLEDGTPLTDSSKATTLNIQAEQLPALKSEDKALEPDNNREWKLFYVGLILCLLSGISISILSEPNTKKVLSANGIRGNDTVRFILAVIFIIGLCMSCANLKKALSNNQQRKAA